MKTKYATAYMKIAYTFAELSYAVRLKVGCIIVKDNRIISIGYNGTPSGWDNECERKVLYHPDTGKQLTQPMLVTLTKVLTEAGLGYVLF